MRTLRTARLVLDEPREVDIVAVFEACQDAQTQRWVPLPRPYTRASAEFFVRSYCPHGAASGQYLVRALREAEALPLVGVVEVRRDEAPGSASIGCWLAPDARGRGLMREALAAVCDNALAPAPDGLGYTRLHWGHLIGNDRSRSLAESLGFDFSASERQRVAIDDEARELLIGVRTA
ncbi:acetyltransferase [Leifsonia xyli subsp. cynodontis DSM 46306]|uniref:N-acetyltransferase domain-containing protein n=1 Tax=Leifsonia xyli subsp. cynodontis DSM 46306 TaxID=1389489 RepID=U3PCW1_LEIXC|nr:GNAT family N-acetyltransferase [Leifsonia xyli]AGW41353.1 acetyltransferase [Leifsonia xyli subsp. cynodontis DSM 46306]